MRIIQTEHTPTPWKLIDGTSEISIPKHNFCVCEGWQRKSIAKHIVKCVNAHDALVKALMQYRTNYAMHDSEFAQNGFEKWVEIQATADKALLLAGIEVPK